MIVWTEGTQDEDSWIEVIEEYDHNQFVMVFDTILNYYSPLEIYRNLENTSFKETYPLWWTLA